MQITARRIAIASIVLAVGLVAIATLATAMEVVLSLVLGGAMIAITIKDAESYIIPDTLSLPMISAGLLAVYLLELNGDPWSGVLLHLAAAALGGGGLYAIRQGYRIWRGVDGLGLGDVKLVMAGGAWCGLQGVSVFLLIACMFAAAFLLAAHFSGRARVHRQAVLPFGAFLAPAIWLTWLLERTAFIQ